MNSNTKRLPQTKSEITNRRNKLVAFIILALVSLVWIFPFVYLIGTSFKTGNALMNPSPKLFPGSGDWTFEHYTSFINFSNHGRLDNLPIWMLNSITVTTLTVVITLLLDAFAAYAFAFFKFRGKKIILAVLIGSMTIPSVIGMTPMFSMYVSIGNKTGLSNVILTSLVGSVDGVERTSHIYLYPYLWLILPGVSSVFNFILMKNFFDSIPMEIIESARSDGASDLKIFHRIVLPLARSTVLLIVLFTFVGSWNDLIWPQLITGSNQLNWTINVALLGYTGGVGSWDLKAAQSAAAIFALLPILIVFFIVQDKMIDGLATTGVKR